jgi:hypothetical protein
LSETGDASLTKGNPGSISDPLNPNLTSPAFSESGLIAGTPPFAQNLLDRLYYNAPFLNNGQSDQVSANISVTDTASPGEPPPSPVSFSPSSVTIDVVTPPLITGTVANQPVAAGGTLNPFSTVGVTDNDFNQTAKDTATITVRWLIYFTLRTPSGSVRRTRVGQSGVYAERVASNHQLCADFVRRRHRRDRNRRNLGPKTATHHRPRLHPTGGVYRWYRRPCGRRNVLDGEGGPISGRRQGNAFVINDSMRPSPADHDGDHSGDAAWFGALPQMTLAWLDGGGAPATPA